MTNARYKKIQYMIRRLSYHMQVCDELHDEETTQRQNFGANMEDETAICKYNERRLIYAMESITNSIETLKEIDP